MTRAKSLECREIGHGLLGIAAFKNTKNTEARARDDGILEFAPGMNYWIC
jgi:hypothetical protein